MRVDFYQLGRDPAEATLPLIARNTLGLGERLLIVSADEAQLDRIGEALWARLPETFLAHGMAGQGGEESQPILLSDRPDPANGAAYMAIADGHWRDGGGPDGDRAEGSGFARTFFLFDDATLHDARACWKMLGTREGLERHFWKQEGGKWIKAA